MTEQDSTRTSRLAAFAQKLNDDLHWGLLVIAASNLGGAIALYSVNHGPWEPGSLMILSASQGVGFFAMSLLVMAMRGDSNE